MVETRDDTSEEIGVRTVEVGEPRLRSLTSHEGVDRESGHLGRTTPETEIPDTPFYVKFGDQKDGVEKSTCLTNERMSWTTSDE